MKFGLPAPTDYLSFSGVYCMVLVISTVGTCLCILTGTGTARRAWKLTSLPEMEIAGVFSSCAARVVEDGCFIAAYIVYSFKLIILTAK